MATDVEFEIPTLPYIGEWVFFYPNCQTTSAPVPAIVTAEPMPTGNTSLTAFLPQRGPVDSLCFPAGSPQITSDDIRRMGCWSRERLDKKVSKT